MTEPLLDGVLHEHRDVLLDAGVAVTLRFFEDRALDLEPGRAVAVLAT